MNMPVQTFTRMLFSRARCCVFIRCWQNKLGLFRPGPLWYAVPMKTALFDLDGTLIDSRLDIVHGINLTREDFNLPALPVAQVAEHIGEGVNFLIRGAIPEFAQTHMELLRARQRINYLNHSLDTTRLYPGMEQTLRKLKAAGWRLGVVTNKSAPCVMPLLKGLGVADCFDAIVGGEEIPQLKPDPAPLRLAAARMGVTLDASDWMIGDHFTDMEAGRNAGIQTCFCRFGFGQLRTSRYTLAVDTVEQIASALLMSSTHPGDHESRA